MCSGDEVECGLGQRMGYMVVCRMGSQDLIAVVVSTRGCGRRSDENKGRDEREATQLSLLWWV